MTNGTTPTIVYNIPTNGTSTGNFTTITTKPASSATATTAFGSSLTMGTALQNTTGYDILVQIGISVTAAASATIIMGIGSTASPTTNVAYSTFSITGGFALTAIVPNNYYLLVDKTGTLTSTNNIIAMPL